MLSKPGEARRTTSSSSTPSSRRHKKVVEENLDDVVRKLQRLPSNKSCADCSSKVCCVCFCVIHGIVVVVVGYLMGAIVHMICSVCFLTVSMFTCISPDCSIHRV